MSFTIDNIDVNDILCEFLEIVIHNVLYIKKLYPDSIFTARKKYGATVYQSLHPGVNNYINQCLKAVQFHAKKNQLRRLFIFIEKDNKLVEKYVFEVLGISTNFKNDLFLIDLEQCLRAFMLKLHASQAYLDDLPVNASFSIKLQTTAYSSLQFNEDPNFEDFPWIEVKDTDVNTGESATIVSIYTIDSPAFKLQSFIEKIAN